MSHVLRVPKTIQRQIEKLLPKLAKLLTTKKLPKNSEVAEILFTDPHSGLIHPAVIFIKSMKQGGWSDAVNCTQFEDGSAHIVFNFRCHAWKKFHAQRRLRVQLRNTLIHEMNHVLDPRPWTLQNQSHSRKFVSRQRHWLDYYTDQCEFDAYCNEIIDSAVREIRKYGCHSSACARWEHLMRHAINPISKQFHKTVRGSFQQEAILAWMHSDSERGTNCMRRFKIRLYNALMNQPCGKCRKRSTCHENTHPRRQYGTPNSVHEKPDWTIGNHHRSIEDSHPVAC